MAKQPRAARTAQPKPTVQPAKEPVATTNAAGDITTSTATSTAVSDAAPKPAAEQDEADLVQVTVKRPFDSTGRGDIVHPGDKVKVTDTMRRDLLRNGLIEGDRKDAGDPGPRADKSRPISGKTEED